MSLYLNQFKRQKIDELDEKIFLEACHNFVLKNCPVCKTECLTMIFKCNKCNKIWDTEILFKEFFIGKFKQYE